MIKDPVGMNEMIVKNERWFRWYSLVLIWHALVILMMFLFTQKFHP